MKKQNMKHKLLSLLGLLVFAGLFIGYELHFNQPQDLDKNGSYTSKEAVSLYLVTYETLPDNYITKSEAMKLGWKSSEGNLWDVTNQKSIGGDIFRNREKAYRLKRAGLIMKPILIMRVAIVMKNVLSIQMMV